ncbi:MAG: hypothetical protein U1F83_01615 [Verrucomicrobiota bacterium]
MNAKTILVAAYSSWEELTQAEGLAIQKEDWARVTECQQFKQGLQKQIIHLTEAAQAECFNCGQDLQHFQSDVRGIINTLIALESRNAEWLTGRRQAAELRKLDLEQVTQNLRRVHKSYTTPTPAVWNSYS